MTVTTSSSLANVLCFRTMDCQCLEVHLIRFPSLQTVRIMRVRKLYRRVWLTATRDAAVRPRSVPPNRSVSIFLLPPFAIVNLRRKRPTPASHRAPCLSERPFRAGPGGSPSGIPSGAIWQSRDLSQFQPSFRAVPRRVPAPSARSPMAGRGGAKSSNNPIVVPLI